MAVFGKLTRANNKAKCDVVPVRHNAKLTPLTAAGPLIVNIRGNMICTDVPYVCSLRDICAHARVFTSYNDVGLFLSL